MSHFRVRPDNSSFFVTGSPITPSKRGDYELNPFPLIRGPGGPLYSWNLPYVNFHKLLKIDTSKDDLYFLNYHLLSMFSDQELKLRGTKLDLFTNVKNVLHTMLTPTSNRIIRLSTSSSEMPLVFFITAMYHEYNSHSIIAEAYILDPSEDLTSLPSLPALDMNVGAEEMQFWTSALPAMAERCRDWEHNVYCEYAWDNTLEHKSQE
jgi:hypothetical protein